MLKSLKYMPWQRTSTHAYGGTRQKDVKILHMRLIVRDDIYDGLASDRGVILAIVKETPPQVCEGSTVTLIKRSLKHDRCPSHHEDDELE
jgi:hypothetical protein